MNAKLLIFLAISSPSLFGDVIFHTPSQEDLLSADLEALNYSLSLTSQKLSDCIDKIIAPPPPKEEVYCYCEVAETVGKGIKLGQEIPLLGKINSYELKLTNGNDNLLNGVLQLDPSLSKYDGNDRGRTFGVESEFRIVGDKGSLNLSANSYGLSKFAPQNGHKKDSIGRHYLNYMEVNSLEFRFDTKLKTDSTPGAESSLYAIGTFMYEHATNEGTVSKEFQRFWHKQFKNYIQYNYVKESEDVKTIKVMGGVGKQWTHDLGKWKCATKAELHLGISQSTSIGRMSNVAELKAYSSLDLSHSRAPWIALNLWLQGAMGHEGISKDGGLELSFPIKKTNYTIKPFVGIQRHYTERDKRFDTKIENYHVIGVVIKY